MTIASPKLDPRLHDAAPACDDDDQSITETWSRVGVLAAELGLPRPGYDTIRLVLGRHRRERAELRALHAPVVGHLVQGRFSSWDVDQLVRVLRGRH